MKTTPWTLRKNVAAVASKAEIAAMEAAIPAMQAQILGLKTLDEANALRAAYVEMPAGPSPVLKRWRVFCLDLLAERIRELRGHEKGSGRPAAVAAAPAAPALPAAPAGAALLAARGAGETKTRKAKKAEAVPGTGIPVALPPISKSSLARAKAKQAAATDVLVDAAKTAGVGAAPTEPTPPEGPKGGAKKKPAAKKKADAKATAAVAPKAEGLSSEAAMVLASLAKLLRVG